MTLRIVGLSGSLRARSSSRDALALALEPAVEAGADVELLDVRTLDLPLYGTKGDTVPPGGTKGETVPPGAARLAESTAEADAMIWSSPLYHGTVSAAFKNALDWLQLLADRDPPFLTNKPVGLIATAGGVQALQAINTMEFVVRALRGWAVPLVVPIARAYQAFDAHGAPRDPAVADQLRRLGHEVLMSAQRFAAVPATTHD